MKSLSKELSQFVQRPFIACIVTGFLLGQIVLAIATHHEHSLTGLAYALVCMLSGAASVATYLKHRHMEQRPARGTAPMHMWLLSLCAGVLFSVFLTGHS